MIHLKTILHPTDFSENSRYALEVASALARDQAARLVVLHVLPRPPRTTGDAPAFKTQHIEEDLQLYREEMARMLTRVHDAAPCAQVEQLVKEGDVATVIARTAEEIPCDVIIMGTHGKSRMAQLMIGSVAAAVARNASCPVIMVKLPGS